MTTMFFDLIKVSKMTNYDDLSRVSKMTILIMNCSKLAKWLIVMTCSKLAVLNKAIHDAFLSLKNVKIDSKNTDLYFRGLWWLIKQSMTLFKSQK